VGNVRYLNPVSGAKPYFYIPMAQNYDSKRTLHVRSSLRPEALSHEVIGVMHAIAPTLPVSTVITMDQQLQGLNGFYLFRINADSSGTLGILGLVLAVIGVYGVVSYATSRRSHEVGLRMALGARRDQILRLFLRQGTKLIGIGVASGIVLSMPLARLISHLLPYVSATDPLVFGGALVLVGGAALLACYLPAYRATRLEPMVVLHHE
jgi:putative ABC transport system permease protein